MSSPNHPTSDIEDAFSSNFPDYIPASPDYSPSSSGNTYSSSLNNSFAAPANRDPRLAKGNPCVSSDLLQRSNSFNDLECFETHSLYKAFPITADVLKFTMQELGTATFRITSIIQDEQLRKHSKEKDDDEVAVNDDDDENDDDDNDNA
ncbi:hypothetical protein Tco_0729121 [Tanacetum coccineum]|uniref:Uncharacterized protein n=1 Tax=Tanacetum coccineum TaxID=301880 RepID=A0ABQ4YQH4_9ASTR